MIENTIRIMLRALRRASSRSFAAVVAVLVAAFFIRVSAYAQDVTSTRIYYPFDNAVVSENYLENVATLVKVEYIAVSAKNAGDCTLEIKSYSSPEGNYNYNKALSARRAAALRDFIVQKHPELKGRINIVPGGEAWEDVRKAVVGDTGMSESVRNAMLTIIDSDAAPDVKEARLKALSNYSAFYRKYFRRFRYAEVSLAEPAGQSSAAPAEGSQIAAQTGKEVAGSDSLSRDTYLSGAHEGERTGADAVSANAGIRSAENVTNIFFPLESTKVEKDYAGNAAVLAAIAALLDGRKPEDFESIVVNSGCSIDGTVATNQRVSNERGQALVDWIEENYPEFKGKVVLNSRGEDWVELREVVVSDDKLDAEAKSAILAIVDSNDSADAKEAKLRELDSWNYIQENILPKTRYANVSGKLAGQSSESAGQAGAAAAAGQSDKAGSQGAGQAVAGGEGSQSTVGRGNENETTGRGNESASQAGEGVRSSRSSSNIFFSLESTKLEEDYAGNDAVFAEIAKMLEENDPDDFESIEVISGCSIDGPVAKNEKFSRERGQALADWIEENYPQYKGKVVLNSRGEDWDELRENVVSDDKLDEEAKSDILTIIDSDDIAEKKEEKLRELDSWDYIKDNVLPKTRYANARGHRKPAPEPEPEPEAPEAPELSTENLVDSTEAVQAPVDSLHVADSTMRVDTIAAPIQKLPLFAVGTNVLLDAAITPNINVEVPINKKWSVYADYAFPWWLAEKNDRAYQMLKWDLGVRRYLSRLNPNKPMDILRGHFLGLDLSAGYYDFEPRHKGIQGEFQLAGLEYGYSWALTDNWRLELCVGAGWMGTHYRKYRGDDTDRHLIYQGSEKLYWFGPTKAGISIKYLFDYTPKQGR